MDIEDKLKKIEERLEAIEKLLFNIPAVVQSAKKTSIKEFLLERKPKSEVETTLYIGYFLEKFEIKESFGVEDLKIAFKAARIPSPKNINDTVNKNISKGYLMDAGKKEKGTRSWILTVSGENAVEGNKKNG